MPSKTPPPHPGNASDYDFQSTDITKIQAQAAIDAATYGIRSSIHMLASQSMKPIDWVAAGLIVKGDQLIISAAPKAGKTLLASQLCLALASGGRFLKWNACEPKKILYLNLEVSGRMFAGRVMQQIGGLQNIEKFRNFETISDELKSFNALDPDDRETIQKLVEKSQADVVVFDVLSRCHSDDENNNSTMKLVLLQLRLITGKATSIVIHHTRKPPAGAEGVNLGAQAMRGASAIHGEADLVLSLAVREGQGARYSLKFSARNVKEPEEMLLDRDDQTLRFFEAQDVEHDRLKQLILRAFGGKDEIQSCDLTQAIADGFSVKERQAKNYIRSAVEQAWIEAIPKNFNPDRKFCYRLSKTMMDSNEEEFVDDIPF